MFVDEAKIYVKAGNGGSGCVSFRREKGVPKGGPDGGDGGKGGDVIIRTTKDVTTLLDLKYQQHYYAKRGGHGRGKNQHGKDGADTVIRVPVGTIIKDAATSQVLNDLTRDGEEVVVSKSGRGGRGNAFFVSPTHQAPRYAQKGEEGEERWLLIELKLMADVGIIGLPNAGKSTLLSRISAARPKVADYPFTTLTPYLGVVSAGEDKSFVAADIPGLIEGSHEGKGLGFQFLRHIERTRLLAHLIDISESVEGDPEIAFKTINRELALYNPQLARKPQVVVATKMDVKESGERLKRLEEFCKKEGLPFFSISSVTGEGIGELIWYLAKRVAELRG